MGTPNTSICMAPIRTEHISVSPRTAAHHSRRDLDTLGTSVLPERRGRTLKGAFQSGLVGAWPEYYREELRRRHVRLTSALQLLQSDVTIVTMLRQSLSTPGNSPEERRRIQRALKSTRSHNACAFSSTGANCPSRCLPCSTPSNIACHLCCQHVNPQRRLVAACNKTGIQQSCWE